LAALSLPVIRNAMVKARNTAIRMDIEGIERGVEAYANKYGDYPPDFSNWQVVNRHLNKAFPRISNVDRTLLYNMCHDDVGVPSSNPGGTAFYPVAIDRSEALQIFLGGLSADESRPFTGPGGPFDQIGNANVGSTLAAIAPSNYQYNIDRTNAFFDYDITRLTLSQIDPTQSVGPLNRVVSIDDGPVSPSSDIVPAYLPPGRQTPYVYFESRTYGYVSDPTAAIPAGDAPFNGYVSSVGPAGAIRPYKSISNPRIPSPLNVANIAEAYRWQKPDSFQLICAGQDDHFGNLAADPSQPTSPVYFFAETGGAIVCNTSSMAIAELPFKQFQERSFNSAVENTHLDNLTNFNERLRMEDNLQD